MRGSKIFFILTCLIVHASLSQAQSLPLQQAQQAFQQKKYDRVIVITSDILRQDSLQMQAYQLKSSSYMAVNEPVLAQKTIENALRFYPGAQNLLWLKAESLLQQGRLDDALSIYKQLRTKKVIPAEKIKPRIGIIYQSKGGAYYHQNDFKRAETYFQKAKKLMPDSLNSYSNMGLLYLKQKKWEKALHVIDDGLKHFPSSIKLMRLRASALYNHKDYSGAISEYKKIYHKNPHDIDIAIQYAQLLLAKGRKKESSDIYKKLFKEHPDSKKVYESLIIFFQKRGNIKAERGALQKMRRQFPDDVSILQRIAETYERQNKWRQARAAYDTMQTVHGRSKSVAFAKAATYIKQDSLQAALAIYNHQIIQQPKDADVLRHKGLVQEKLKQWHGAKQTYEKLTEVSDSSDTYAKLGQAQLHLNENKRALLSFEKAIQHQSDSPNVYLEAAKLNFDNNKKTMAFDQNVLALNKALTQVRFQQNAIQQKFKGKRNIYALNNDDQNQARTLKKYNELAIDAFHFMVQNFAQKKVSPILKKLQADYPNSGELLYMISCYYADQNKIKKSIRLLKKSLQLSPSLAKAHISLGDYYKSHHQMQKALLSYERALSADPKEEKPYQELIRIYRSEGELDQLCNRWMARYKGDRSNHILREYLIEALHKADRFKEAKKIIEAS